ncbi:MAG: hypothetical protein OQJ84_12425 [Xanthomonadales bacterium]|nr:hypothetical protein [Xanthomonadales bacterium]
MRPKQNRDLQQADPDLYDDYYDDLPDDIDEFEDLAIDFYSTEWENPAGQKRQISARRQIERRNEFKEFYSELDGWGDYDLKDEW